MTKANAVVAFREQDERFNAHKREAVSSLVRTQSQRKCANEMLRGNKETHRARCSGPDKRLDNSNNKYGPI